MWAADALTSHAAPAHTLRLRARAPPPSPLWSSLPSRRVAPSTTAPSPYPPPIPQPPHTPPPRQHNRRSVRHRSASSRWRWRRHPPSATLPPDNHQHWRGGWRRPTCPPAGRPPSPHGGCGCGRRARRRHPVPRRHGTPALPGAALIPPRSHPPSTATRSGHSRRRRRSHSPRGGSRRGVHATTREGRGEEGGGGAAAAAGGSLQPRRRGVATTPPPQAPSSTAPADHTGGRCGDGAASRERRERRKRTDRRHGPPGVQPPPRGMPLTASRAVLVATAARHRLRWRRPDAPPGDVAGKAARRAERVGRGGASGRQAAAEKAGDRAAGSDGRGAGVTRECRGRDDYGRGDPTSAATPSSQEKASCVPPLA